MPKRTRKLKDEREALPSSSSFDRLKECPPSFKAGSEAKSALPKGSNSSLAANRGTAMHLAMETGEPGDLSKEELELCDQMHELKEFLLSEVGLGDTDIEVATEKRRWYKKGKKKLFSGKFDYEATGRPDSSLQVTLQIDWKTFSGAYAPAPSNMQLRANAVLRAQETNFSDDELWVALVQPLSSPQFSLACYTRESLLQAEAEIVAIAEKAIAGGGEFGPSESSCKYCAARGLCPATREKVLELARIETNALSDPSRLNELLHAAKLAVLIIPKIEEAALVLLKENPEALSDFVLSTTSVRSKISDLNACRKYLVAACIITESDFDSAVEQKNSLSAKALTDLIAVKNKLNKRQAKALWQTDDVEWLSTSGGNPTIKPRK